MGSADRLAERVSGPRPPDAGLVLVLEQHARRWPRAGNITPHEVLVLAAAGMTVTPEEQDEDAVLSSVPK